MNKKWTEQKYVIYFLLSVMALGVCGGVCYGASCCQNGGLRDEGAELAWTVGEADERYAAYTASEQRVIAVDMLAYDGEPDGGQEQDGVNEGPGQAGLQTQEAPGETADGDAAADADGHAAAGADGHAADRDAADDGNAAESAAADADGHPADNAAADESNNFNMGAGESGQAGEDTETEPETEDGAGVQTGGRVIAVTDEDYEALLRIVQAEAGNEDTKGKILVANVVLNRVADERFPNSIYEVVFQRAGGKAQFSPIASGSYYKVVVSDDTREAVERALSGEDYSEGALFFAARRYAGSSQMRWFDECLTKLFSYGGHEFFTS